MTLLPGVGLPLQVQKNVSAWYDTGQSPGKGALESMATWFVIREALWYALFRSRLNITSPAVYWRPAFMGKETFRGRIGASMGRILWWIANPVIANPYVTPPLALLASTKIQYETWQDIGDPMTGAIHYSQAGMMTGSSMPVVQADFSSGDPYGFKSWWTKYGW